MTEYIYQRPEWPNLTWNQGALAIPLAEARLRQGRLIGQMEQLGFKERDEAALQALTQEIVKSSEIEGEILNTAHVRSSIARRLGIDAGALSPADRTVEGVVEMTLEATQNHAVPLSKERLFGWHRLLFAGRQDIKIGIWRDDSKGPMQIVSGALGRERAHYEAPPAERLDLEMATFLDCVNDEKIDPIPRAAKAHFWFVTVHPFDDGNGRIARAISEWALAKSENSPRRYYGMSAQIRKDRKEYYEILEQTSKGAVDITDWMLWFLGCLDRAIAGSEASLSSILGKDRFWKTYAALALNERQRSMLNRILDGTFEGKLTSTKWAKMMKCSQDAAYRDILDLASHGILSKDSAGGRSTSYSLTWPK